MKSNTRKTIGALGAFWLAFAAAARAASPSEVAPELGVAQKGDLIIAREVWLKGSPLPFQSTQPLPVLSWPT